MRQSWLSSPEPSSNTILNVVLFIFILGVANASRRLMFVLYLLRLIDSKVGHTSIKKESYY